MNKQSDYKSDCLTLKGGVSDVTPKFVPIGFGAVVGGVKTTFTAKSQESVYLKSLLCDATTFGVVNDIRIGNQSLNCSDSAIELKTFTEFGQRRPVIGLAVDGNIQMSIDITLDGVGSEAFQGGFTCEAIEKAPTIAQQGNAINKFFGLGSVSVPASGTAQLTAQALRDCMLKDLLIKAHEANAFGLVVTDITIKGRSIFSGQSGDAVGVNALNEYAQSSLVAVNTAIETNERVVVTLANGTAGAIVVSGAFYAE